MTIPTFWGNSGQSHLGIQVASLVADEIHAHQGASRSPTTVVAAKNHSSTPTLLVIQWFIGIYNNHYKDPYYGWDDHQPYSEYWPWLTWISWDFPNESFFFGRIWPAVFKRFSRWRHFPGWVRAKVSSRCRPRRWSWAADACGLAPSLLRRRWRSAKICQGDETRFEAYLSYLRT